MTAFGLTLLFFLGLATAYPQYQDRLILREGLLVAFFLAGLLTLCVATGIDHLATSDTGAAAKDVKVITAIDGVVIAFAAEHVVGVPGVVGVQITL